MGCAMPEAEQGLNVARISALRAGLPIESAAFTVNRFCASGLQSIALAADRIRGGGAEVIVAGGTESMSMVPSGGNKPNLNPWLEENHPTTYISMVVDCGNASPGITRLLASMPTSSHSRVIRKPSPLNPPV